MSGRRLRLAAAQCPVDRLERWQAYKGELAHWVAGRASRGATGGPSRGELSRRRSTGARDQARFAPCPSPRATPWPGCVRSTPRLGALGSDVAEIKADLAQVRDEVMVTSAICLRLEAREVEAKGLLALYQRLKAGQERLESRAAALEGREPT